ncbi:hypothetical protein VST7929_01888 [Vibrio stylophorae]|uniref:Histidine kinase n=1 Tax=Vibrio stylophorae TaxID=659351 RepID=A0ABM8ZUL8_9VIBR|nr:Bax inhibitor-1 family protein [Vibrio stylophorae]CAH0534006.1 hypothetical protein VST7929_01888 [Vibrio stylophorae]
MTDDIGVFDRRSTSNPIISGHLYNLLIGLTLSWGFLVNWWMVANISPYTIASVNPWVFFIGYFASCFTGVMLFGMSDKPWVSFIGYNLVVVPFGFIINLVVSQYDPSLVMQAIQVTAMVTGIMMVLGTLFPAFFQGIARTLSIALLVVIVVELVMIFFFKQDPEIIDWIVVLIFCGYIGVDWGRANMIPKTVDNAIDSAAALYMDIINLFLRILRIMGRRN